MSNKTVFEINDSRNEPSLSITSKQSNKDDFSKTIQHYLKVNKPHICILTPCYGSVCFVNYVKCLIQTYQVFESLGIPLTVEFCKNDSLVSRARNNLVAKAMSNPAITHMLFIDSDITWDPVDIVKLLISDKSLVGGSYPLKKYNWETIMDNPQTSLQNMINRKNNSQLKNAITDEEMLRYNLVRYNINFLDSYLTIENNLTKVRHLATGFMMIKRNTITQMCRAFPQTKYTDDVGFLVGDENNFAYALFDCGVEEDHYFSEDWLFCHRWTKMGGNIYLDVSINLTHTGLEDFRGSFIASVL
jgi:hypothetical protein